MLKIFFYLILCRFHQSTKAKKKKNNSTGKLYQLKEYTLMKYINYNN